MHSDKPWSAESTDASVTVMAYKSSRNQLDFYRLDLATLQSIHGAADSAPRNFQLEEPDIESKFINGSRTSQSDCAQFIPPV